MNLRSVDLNLLTVFDAVIREGNLTRAAANIGMSQPAISDAVARLRHLLKDDLFIRTGHGVRPTPRALQYAAPIRRILDLVIMTLSEAQAFDHVTSHRRFNLVLREYGELVLLPPLMQWLDSMGSSVVIGACTVPHKDVAEALRSGAIDIYLATAPLTDVGYTSLHVFTEQLVSVVRRDHPQVHNSLSLEQFLELNHVILEWPDIPTPRVDQVLHASGLRPRKCQMRVHSLFDMPRVVASTNMICSLPVKMAQSFAETHKLKAFPVPLDGVEIPLYLCWHERFDNDAGHTWMRETLASLISR
ncbi:TPA: LysR family transcriptional regulator [Pseudomonas aeruginosa]|nr:LysR family transcriptional regulator [Pseudomonas aeruginosa]HCA5868833.1 LysR family transcriptional regulator [Pseudomonas aeruginosa]HCA7379610.1 LysR family transcriptional regulator [Pseudomonas aeruginosa]HCA7777471.1 LysR family transcriptional regulator [Pseudomonas aeruginosa]